MQDTSSSTILASYVPRLIKNHIIENPTPSESPVAEQFQAVLLFADISGFTLLTERLTGAGGAEGAEKLADMLNDYFGQLIEIINDFGGDVVKFAGDALISVWPVDDNHDSQRTWTLRAAQCALKIREKLHQYRVEDINLRLKVAISTGTITQAHVGGVFNRWEFLLAGRPLVELGTANDMAEPGDILVTPSAWALIQKDVTGTARTFSIQGKSEEGAYLIKLNNLPPEFHPEDSTVVPENLEISLKAYIPGAIINRISAGHSGWIAELRNVTVLFINLPDVNEHTPLDSSQAIARLLQRSIYRYEGSINKINVDDKGITLVAALGLPPFAHMDDPARGIQAALLVRDELNNIGVRSFIGVTTGRLFCGAIGNSRRREYTLLGNVVNLSARLMTASSKLTALIEKRKIPILCDRPTYESAKDIIEFETLPAQHVKGRTEAIDVFHPVTQRKSLIRQETELIGRQEEKSILANALQELQRGAPSQTVIILGEAGIGKSRLTDEAIRQANSLGVQTLTGGGDSVEKNTPYFAWRRVFDHIFNIHEIVELPTLTDEDRQEIRQRVAARLEAVDPEFGRYAPLMSVLLPTEIPDNDFTAPMTGEIRGGNIRELLTQLLTHEVQKAPTMILLEDLHWLDSASWTLLVEVQQKVTPLLLTLNTRPLPESAKEFGQLIGHEKSRLIKLDALPLADVDALVCQRLGVKSIPSEIAQLVREKSEGHPFFAEELSFALRDSGILQIENQEARLSSRFTSLEQVTLPDNLQAAITSRIDNLSPSQQLTLKVASVIGRIFAFRILQAIYPIDGEKPSLGSHMDMLTRLSLTVVESEEPDLEYIFKHALTQEVAYNLMLFSQRRQLHHTVAEWLENTFEEDLPSYYHLLAYHWTQATSQHEGSRDPQTLTKSILYLEKAGDQALNAFANSEAIQFFESAIRISEQLEPDRLRSAQWRRKIGKAYLGLGKLDKAQQEYFKALDLLGVKFPVSMLAQIGGVLGQFFRQIGHRLLPNLFRHQKMSQLKRDIRFEAVQTYLDLATVLFLLADPNPLPIFYSVIKNLNLAETLEDTAELGHVYAQVSAIAGFIPLRSQAKHYARLWDEMNAKFNNDQIYVSATNALAAYESGMGMWAELEPRLERVFKICTDIGDHRQGGDAIGYLVGNILLQGRYRDAQRYQARQVEHSARRHNPVLKIWIAEWMAYLLIEQGKYEQTIPILEDALKIMAKEPVGDVAEYIINGMLAEIKYIQGDPQGLKTAQALIEKLSKSSIVDYSIYPGLRSIGETIFHALQDPNQPDKAGITKSAHQVIKVLKGYSAIFEIGVPILNRCTGYLAWQEGKQKNAFAAWQKGLEKARDLKMYFEQAQLEYEIGLHEPLNDPEREAHWKAALEMFKTIGLENRANQIQNELDKA